MPELTFTEILITAILMMSMYQIGKYDGYFEGCHRRHQEMREMRRRNR